MNIKADMIPAISDGIRVREEYFGGLVVSKRTPVLTMNEDSFAIWENINGKNSVADIISILQENYVEQDSGEYLSTIVVDFIKDCIKLGLLEISNTTV